MTFYLAVVGDNPTSQEICRQATSLHGYKLVELILSGSGAVHVKGEPSQRLHSVVVTQAIPDSYAQALLDTAREMGSSFVMGVEKISPSTQALIHQASAWAIHAPCAAPNFLALRGEWLPSAIAQARSDLIKSVDIQTITAVRQAAPESMAQLRDTAQQACDDLIEPKATWTQDAKACQEGEERHTVTVTSHMGKPQTISITTGLREHAKGLLALARQMPNDPKRSFPFAYKYTL